MLSQLDSPEAPIAPPGHEDMQCPVFAALLEAVAKREGASILDLGRAHGAQLQLLAPFRCKLYFEDAHELVQDLSGDAEEDSPRLRRWLDQWTASGPGSIDVVLAWDFLNYLEAPLFAAFVAHLRPLLRPGALIYFLVYTQRDMPALPMHYKAVGTDRLAYRTDGADRRPSPRLSQMEIKRRLGGFGVVKSVLLRNGIQEYLLKL